LQFLKILTYNPGSQPFFATSADKPPTGTCAIFNNLDEKSGVNPIASAAELDAGSSFTLTGPNGSVQIPLNSQKLGAFDATGNFLVPGDYTITGTGGAEIGSFTANFRIPASPKLVSPVDGAVVTRASGMTVTWTGGAGDVLMELASCSDNSCTGGASAACFAPASAGSFIIPPYILNALPASTSAGFVFSTSVPNEPFTLAGLDLAFTNVEHYNLAGFGIGWASGSFALK
jgi:hypothetical protein